METTNELPKEYVNVMLTYKAQVTVRDKYYDHKEEQTVTRRAFYSKSDGYYDSKNNWIETPNGYFSVPQYWKDFTFSDGSIALLPHTFYSFGRPQPHEIIDWKYEKP